jgi:phage-related holin
MFVMLFLCRVCRNSQKCFHFFEFAYYLTILICFYVICFLSRV